MTIRNMGLAGVIALVVLSVLLTEVRTAAATQPARPPVGIAPSLWNNLAYRRWLQRYRQERQQTLFNLQQSLTLSQRQAEHLRLQMLRRNQDQMEASEHEQLRLQAARLAAAAELRRSCLSSCVADRACPPGPTGAPELSCPATALSCQASCH